ncbi:MAG: YbaK/EbsC family protein [Thaumarchaeota archaeon]|nr:YbaK/EbsC family protein [Nitrososphaerota archaeon]
MLVPSTGGGIDTVQQFIRDRGIEAEIRILAPESTRTSASAAEALGDSIAEIAKTIGFVLSTLTGVNPILVILSGDKRVSMPRLVQFLQIPERSLRKMTAEEVKDLTGYSIGEVPPFPHRDGIRTLVDQKLFRFDKVWAAAGSTNALMHLSPLILVDQLGLELAQVSE